MKVSIREATVDDAEDVRVYAKKLFSEELPGLFRRPAPTLEDERLYLDNHCRQENSVILLAWAEGRVAGLIALRGETHPQEAHVGTIGISVDSDYRGCGIGTLLIERLLLWAAAHGLHRIEIDAFANNTDAIRLYERLGFQHEGLLRDAISIDGDFVDAVILARLI